jgi:hypothetical protein
VRAALAAGLTAEEIGGTIGIAHTVRGEAGAGVAGFGRRLLGWSEEAAERAGHPADREDALIHIGAAAGCNAGGLLASYLSHGRALGLSEAELRAAVDVAKLVKKGAAMFMDREADRALGGAAGECVCGPDFDGGPLRSLPR